MATALEDLRILQNIEEVADSVWTVVATWDKFAQGTIGKQLVRAVDSIGANVAESYGRFHFGEKVQFLYYGRGSLFESKYWLNRSYARHLINEEQHNQYAHNLNSIGKQLNSFANNLKKQKRTNKGQLREETVAYTTQNPKIELFTKDDLNWLASTNLQSRDRRSQISNLPTKGNNHD